MKTISEQLNDEIHQALYPEPQVIVPTTMAPDLLAATFPKININKFPEYFISEMIEYGDKSKDVSEMQARVKSLGYPISVDGHYGPQTKLLVSRLQKSQGLPGSGIVGPITLALLNIEFDTRSMPKVQFHPLKSKRRWVADLNQTLLKEILKTQPEFFYNALYAGDANLIKSVACQAMATLKVRERTGNNDGELVEMIQKVSDGVKGYAWCMYQQMSGIAFSEGVTGLTSPVVSSGSCAEVRKKTKSKNPELIVDISKAERGDLVIWLYLAGNGHVGDFYRWISKPKSAELFEGNTTQGLLGGKVEREGGGSYQTARQLNSDKMKVAMIVRPFKEAA